MKKQETPAPAGFEQAMERLQTLLAQLQDEATPLAQAVQLYAEAADLIAYCHQALTDAKLQIEEIDAALAQKQLPAEA